MRRIKPKLVNLDKFYEGLLAMSAFDDVPYDDLRELIAKSEVNAYYPEEVIAMLEKLLKDIANAAWYKRFEGEDKAVDLQDVELNIKEHINALKENE